jgi:ATP/maltotriose-dependent transcriptional regulator MalT
MTNINELRLLAQDCKLAGSPVFVRVAVMDELLDRLEAAEEDIARRGSIIDSLGSILNEVANERDALWARIEAMEKQEPLWFIDERGEPKRYHKSKADYCKYGGLDLLYALPGAKGE